MSEHTNRAADQRRLNARARGYDARWDKAREFYLKCHPLCRRCEEMDRAVAAKVVDHIVPHHGDQTLFWDVTNWQPLCGPCHNRWKQRQERQGLSPEAVARTIPVVAPSRIPLIIVCGPPGSGKSTYVEQRRGDKDLVIDLDIIRADLAGTAIHQANGSWTGRALEQRNRILAGLATDAEHDRAWFIVAAPATAEREEWRRRLGAEHVIVMTTPLDECVRRIRADHRRAGHHRRMEGLVADWFRIAAAGEQWRAEGR